MNDPPIQAVLTQKLGKIYILGENLRLQKNVFIQFWTKWVEYIRPLQPDFVEV